MEREFKGVWIPRDIWLDNKLNMLEKGILTEIDSLDNENGCSAGNEYLAKFCQCSETKVSTAISKLIALGYIYVKSFDGRIRILKSRLSNFERQDLINLKADFKILKGININNNKDNNIYIYIQEVFDFWNSKKIIVHKNLTDGIRDQIIKSLKVYQIEQIKSCIDRYSTILNDKDYYLKYKWTLKEFLKQENAISTFTDEGSKWISYQSYLKDKKKTCNFDERNYDLNETMQVFDNLNEIKFD